MEIKQWKSGVNKLKEEIFTLYYAYQNPDTPIFAKLVTILVVAYAFSPIDLIPDFIPILGYLDDFILLPFGVLLAIKLIPQNILDQSRKRAHTRLSTKKPKNWVAGTIFLLIWIILLSGLVYYLYNTFGY
ncbi:Protein of unknown function [Seinonella peptonophila]|uniref:DUF1232 domain-containing protein n=1 Tax=Seinonella peptonophila TaxID=112248 RepID=A0A1M4ZAY4_9BACL|nr:YkvA family protein [Seinonella peptonophila]SHF15174.1 Protein of unknown function [Seinonella peptonophila]